ncbi:hypothetical protein B0H13DRAFT_2082002 [Mycena leptocephala]|nr:hypothetical protein B0H13DRAFT_2082002 [Mycena leptocephala]
MISETVSKLCLSPPYVPCYRCQPRAASDIWMSYSITVDWKQDKLYHYLDALRADLGSFANATPICDKCSAHDLAFDRMPDEPFGEKCVAVPLSLSNELEKIWGEVHAFCIGWSLKLAYPNFKPHATISMGNGHTRGIHNYVRTSLLDWADRHGAMKARAVGLDLWKHWSGTRELVENFPLQILCMCSICDRARRMEIHGCSCRICIRAMVAQLRMAE